MLDGDDTLLIPEDVRRDAFEVRSLGGLPVVIAALLFFGGLFVEEPVVLVAGIVAFPVALVLRSRAQWRALSAMTPDHAQAVQAEMRRGRARPDTRSWVHRLIIEASLWLLLGGLLVWLVTR